MKVIEECLKNAFLHSVMNLIRFCQLINDFVFHKIFNIELQFLLIDLRFVLIFFFDARISFVSTHLSSQ